MKHLLVIGVGVGDPDAITVDAIAAMRTVDVFIVLDKGENTRELSDLRRAMLQRHLPDGAHRVIEVRDTVRDSTVDYQRAVRDWHHERMVSIESAIIEHVGAEETAAMLVWGDPSIYDSTIRVVDQLLERGTLEFDFTVMPGISSIQLLCARHRITLNRIGRSVLMTTGRLLRDGVPVGVDDVVVLLDASTSFVGLVGHGYEIFWGAYLGSAEEILISGPLDEVAEAIVRARDEARTRKGWVFDLYLLRRLD
ncbi:MAG: precorrin-6A synthase (deacetylating) [Ilumatobacteraceae bacterium]|nr:precorrin-6A synthase (deacetylating) [Ilumatobacteraceae bacterium]